MRCLLVNFVMVGFGLKQNQGACGRHDTLNEISFSKALLLIMFKSTFSSSSQKRFPLTHTVVERKVVRLSHIENSCPATVVTRFSEHQLRWLKPREKGPSLSSASQCARPRWDRGRSPSVEADGYTRCIVRGHIDRMFSRDL